MFVAERLAEPDAGSGGELDGFWIWPDETRCPNGPLAAVRLAELVASRGLLVEQLAETETLPIVHASIETDWKAAVMGRVQHRLTAESPGGDLLPVDGVSVDLEDGWSLRAAPSR